MLAMMLGAFALVAVALMAWACINYCHKRKYED